MIASASVHRRQHHWKELRTITAILVAAGVGCGQADIASVAGQLTRKDGTPLAGALVSVRSIEGKWARGRTDSQGRFELGTGELGDGVTPGDYAVTIAEDRGDGDNPIPMSIADKYRDPEQSGLKLSVQAGQQTEFNVTLDSP